jgi:hypothetical protein
MKRAAMVLVAVASLVLLGLPSVPGSDSSCYASTALATAPHGVPVSGARIGAGGPATGGPTGGGAGDGSNEGDADGLSGYKNAPPSGRIVGSEGVATRVRIFAEMWWQFMTLIR